MAKKCQDDPGLAIDGTCVAGEEFDRSGQRGEYLPFG